MVKFTTKLRVVNAMSVARGRGHGCVKRYLESVGVARSTGYRWKLDLQWLLDHGPSELRRLRRELAVAKARFEALCATRWLAPPLSRDQERAFILEAAVLGNSDEEVAMLLARVGGRRLSHQTIHAIIQAAAAAARRAYAEYFAGVGTVGAADEIFLGHRPLLLFVEPLSLLISALRLAASRGAADWEPLFAIMRELERCAADAARGLGKAATEAGVPRQLDLFHLLYRASAWLAHYASTYDAKAHAAAAAQKDHERARRQGNKTASYSACRRRDHARRAAERIIEEYCRLDDLMNQIKRAFDYTTADGKLNTAAQARPRVAEAIEAIKQTPEGERLARHLRGAERPEAFAHLEVLAAGLRTLPFAQLGPEPEAIAARMVAQTVAWRRRHKEPVTWLAQAANGSVADHVELAVIRLVDLAVRSSSSVECVNARIRLVQVARKRLSEDFIYLLAVHHNMKPFGRGSVREGHTPAELAGIELPTDDWIELLDLTASEPAQGSADAV